MTTGLMTAPTIDSAEIGPIFDPPRQQHTHLLIEQGIYIMESIYQRILRASGHTNFFSSRCRSKSPARQAR